MDYTLLFASFVFGAVIGSFLNAVIYRLPRGKSLVKPKHSFCPNCGKQINWYDNIPILSYIILGGKCRNCKNPIGKRYLIVEILTGIASVVAYLKTGFTVDYFFVFSFFAILIAITFIDLDFQIIPDELNLTGFILGLVYLFIRKDMEPVDGLIGAVAGSGLLWLIGYLYLKLRGIEGLGMGDVKMMVFVGVYLGWFGALFTVFFGALLGVVAGVISATLSKAEDKGKFAIPFGPFLAIASAVYMLFGDQIKSWYFGGLM
ncbi:MAG: prepilin peptidase [Aquificae bacterium]|nr:prepilin peptidase [Aquificota bacterium]